MLYEALCIISKPSVNSNWSYSPKTLNSGQNWWFSVPCGLEIWRMTLKYNRAPLLYCVKLCASFQGHRSILTGVTVRKRSIWVKIGYFSSRVTFKFDRWPWKPIGHLFYATSSFMHNFITIGESDACYSPETSNLGEYGCFFGRVTFKCDRWSWKTIGHISSATSSFVHHFIAICEFELELKSGNGWIWFWPLWPWPLTSDLDLSHGHHFGSW